MQYYYYQSRNSDDGLNYHRVSTREEFEKSCLKKRSNNGLIICEPVRESSVEQVISKMVLEADHLR